MALEIENSLEMIWLRSRRLKGAAAIQFGRDLIKLMQTFLHSHHDAALIAWNPASYWQQHLALGMILLKSMMMINKRVIITRLMCIFPGIHDEGAKTKLRKMQKPGIKTT